MNKRILVTGAAGFIGSNLVKRLSNASIECIGIDNFDDYYSKDLKLRRMAAFEIGKLISDINLNDLEKFNKVLQEFNPTDIVHLAAQPGVRYSGINPNSYIVNNIFAFENIISACKSFQIPRLFYASSSSVYGIRNNNAFLESDRGGEVKNLYALSKRFNEDRAILELPGIESVGMRFFSVYGPWGRPDMAYFRVIGTALGLWDFQQFGNGEQKRDYTYVDDVIETIFGLLNLPKLPTVINIGGGQPISLNEMKIQIDSFFGSKVRVKEREKDESEAFSTLADTNLMKTLRLPVPKTSAAEGIEKVCNWALTVDKEDFLMWLQSSK
jgi:UDP-glucuronate 4-epimerase